MPHFYADVGAWLDFYAGVFRGIKFVLVFYAGVFGGIGFVLVSAFYIYSVCRKYIL